jgi:hypothetical protein
MQGLDLSKRLSTNVEFPLNHLQGKAVIKREKK